MNGSSTWNDTSMCWNGTCMPMEMVNKATPKVIAIVIPLIFALTIIVGVFGNILVMVVVFCNQQMRSTTNILITNLAVADILFLVFCAPFSASKYVFFNWVFGDIWCRIFQYLCFVTSSVSIYTLVLLSLNRFLAVVYPISSKSIRTTRKVYLAISCVWIVVLISFIPLLLTFGEVLNPSALENNAVCGFLVAQGYSFTAFQVSIFALAYIIPFTIIFVLYLLMMKKLLYRVPPVGQSVVRSKMKVTRLIIVVVVIFAVCWSPVQIIYFLRSIRRFGQSSTNVILRSTAEIMAYFNSCVNPILYAFLSENFRKAFRKLLFRCHPRTCGNLAESRTSTVDENLNIPDSSKDSKDII